MKNQKGKQRCHGRRYLSPARRAKSGGYCAIGLKADYDLRLLYHRTVLPAGPGEEVYVASIKDLDKMVEVVGGVDSVVHMAGDPEVGASFQSVYENNILGTYCIYEAAHRNRRPPS